MKFYYNGKLVRTSKTMVYKYAIINTETGKVVRCSKDMKGIDKGMTELKEWLRYYESLRDGTYRQRHSWEATRKQGIESAIKEYGSLENAINKQKEWLKRFIVVELEAR